MFEGKVVRLSEHCSLIVRTLDFAEVEEGATKRTVARSGPFFFESCLMFVTEAKWTLKLLESREEGVDC